MANDAINGECGEIIKKIGGGIIMTFLPTPTPSQDPTGMPIGQDKTLWAALLIVIAVALVIALIGRPKEK